MKLKITTTICVDDNITGEQFEQIREEFQETAWANDIRAIQPKVTIEELQH